jgi:hypothetical protein
MRDGEEKGQAFEASFPSNMPLGQKVLLTVFFACTEGQDRRIQETHAELAAMCGMAEPDYFRNLIALRVAGIIRDVGHGRGLNINRAAIKNVKAIDERAARAAKHVRGGLSKLPEGVSLETKGPLA